MISIDNYEIDALGELAEKAADNMKAVLYEKYEEGRRGWDNPKRLPALKKLLVLQIDKGFDADNMIHVMNYAAMIWNQVEGEKK